MTISDFVRTLSKGQSEALIERLDELVHDAKAFEAAEISNAGVEYQAEYLTPDATELAKP